MLVKNSLDSIWASKKRCTSYTKEQQEAIVAILNSFLEKEQQAKSAAEPVLTQIDSMKKAILVRAFRGELGTNDPSEEWAGELLKAML